MLDLSNYDIEIKKPLTRAEYDERVKKGLIKYGEVVEVYNEYGKIVDCIIIFPPNWESTIEDLQKDNWQNKRLIRHIYKDREDLWAYMKENNRIPKDVINEIESEEEKLEWNL